MSNDQPASDAEGGFEHLKAAIGHFELAGRAYLSAFATAAGGWLERTIWRVALAAAAVVVALFGLVYLINGCADYVQSCIPGVAGAGAMIVGGGVIVLGAGAMLLLRWRKSHD